MPHREPDRRTWRATDRPGESFTISRPLLGVEVVSVRGSHRHWRDVHDSFTLAAIHRTREGVVADWHTRARSLSTEAGGIMAIEPGDAHVTQRLKLQAGAADFDIVRFSPELVADAMHELGFVGQFHFKSPAATDTPTFAALERLVAAAASGDALETECASTAALRVLVSRLSETAAAPIKPLNPVRDFRLRKVRDYLSANLDRRPSLAELETISDLSRYHLCSIFRAAYGMTIGHYGNACRLAEAQRRLRRGTPIKLLVSELGYVDEPYFSRVFKQQYGVAPGAWLSTLRANGGGDRALAR
jgi:AraC-like DNA-binding protein